jgi:hypothetical protein
MLVAEIIGPVGYHWTRLDNIPRILAQGLGSRIDHSVSGHHTWYLWDELGEWPGKQEALLRSHGQENEWGEFEYPHGREYTDAWDEAVHQALQAVMPDASITWVADTPEGSREFGEVLVEVDLVALQESAERGADYGFMFPDLAFGWGVVLEEGRLDPSWLRVVR